MQSERENLIDNAFNIPLLNKSTLLETKIPHFCLLTFSHIVLSETTTGVPKPKDSKTTIPKLSTCEASANTLQLDKTSFFPHH